MIYIYMVQTQVDQSHDHVLILIFKVDNQYNILNHSLLQLISIHIVICSVLSAKWLV